MGISEMVVLYRFCKVDTPIYSDFCEAFHLKAAS